LNPILFYVQDGWRVTSPFGKRVCPFCGGAKCAKCNGTGENWHNGIDFGGKLKGYPVKTPYAGTVTTVGAYGDRGRLVVVRITNEILQITQHLDEIKVSVGDELQAGDIVGTNGATGRVTGAHLHYELRLNNGGILGNAVWGDPAKFTMEDNMLDYAIIYYGTPDLYLAEPLAARYKAPLYPLRLAGAVSAKTVFVIGGPEIDVPGAGEVIRLSGETRYHTAKAVAEHLGIDFKS